MKKTKVIMIDAFKPEYLEYAPYLKLLSKNNQYGELDMGVGHWRGVDIIFNGNSDIIANFYKNENSLNYFKYFIWLDSFGKLGKFFVNILFNFPRFIKGYEMFKINNKGQAL